MRFKGNFCGFGRKKFSEKAKFMGRERNFLRIFLRVLVLGNGVWLLKAELIRKSAWKYEYQVQMDEDYPWYFSALFLKIWLKMRLNSTKPSPWCTFFQMPNWKFLAPFNVLITLRKFQLFQGTDADFSEHR